MFRQGLNSNGESLRDFYVEHDPVNVHFAQVGEPGYDGKTRQEDAEAADINVLMARYERTGVLPLNGREGTGQYADLTNMPDYREALDMVREAGVAFFALPANVRKEFDNDPAQFVEFAQNPENLAKMREWGLAPMPPEEPKPAKVEVVNSDKTPVPPIANPAV